MSDPRWTVDESTRGAWLMDGDDPAAWFARSEDAHLVVVAVRDADTLHQARDFAAKIRPFVNLPGQVDRTALDVLLDLLAPPAPDDRRGRLDCPDGGRCHHDCGTRERCWRVDNAEPLSGVFPNDQWPAPDTGDRP